MKKICLFLLGILFFVENCWATQDLILTVKANQSNYKVGDEIIIDFVITNQSKEDIEIYFINTFEGERYLSIETLDGDKIPYQSFVQYVWANPSFHLIKAGGSLKKEIKGIITDELIRFENKELKFKDVVYDLNGLDKIRIVGVFSCKKKLYYPRIKKDFWIGEIKASPVLIKIE